MLRGACGSTSRTHPVAETRAVRDNGAMPIFEYRCADCGGQFELFVQSSTTPACPSCASEQLDKKLSVFAVGRGQSLVPAMPANCQGCPDADGAGGCAAA